MEGESIEPTAFAVVCPAHGLIYLTEHEYNRQMYRSDSKWECPHWEREPPGICGRISNFSDEVFEAAQEEHLP